MSWVLFIFVLPVCLAADVSYYTEWMGNEKTWLHSKTLSEITFPGTHDSGTYDLMFRVSPELDPFEAELLDVIETLAPDNEVFSVINGWSKAQNFSLADQLVMGIRYFDIRVCWDNATDEFRIHHLIMSTTTLQETLLDVASFLKKYPSEFVVLQLSHFAGLSNMNHLDLISYLNSTFGILMLPSSYDLSSTSLGTILGKGYQILIFYDNPIEKNYPFLWNTASLLSVWANQDEIQLLRQYQLENVSLKSGNPKLFYFPQWILTPRPKDIIEGLLPFAVSNLHEFSRRANSQWDSFLKNITSYRVNVLFGDWFQESDMMDRVISLNHLCNDDPKFRSNSQVPNCHSYAESGRCVNPDAFMTENCRLTCGLCPVAGEPGDACKKDSDCLSGTCHHDKCLGYNPAGRGSPCGVGTQCVFGRCIDFECT